jgi:hypothetical protein
VKSQVDTIVAEEGSMGETDDVTIVEDKVLVGEPKGE